jgi:hypothetical protein
MPSVNPNVLTAVNNGLSTNAQQAYYMAKLAGDTDTAAFQKAQAAVAYYGNLASTFGYSPSGDPYTWGAGGPQAPPPGTPTSAISQSLGYNAYVPGYTGTGAGQTTSALGAAAGTAQSAAGLTGFYTAPSQSRWTPGTFLRIDPSTYDYGTYGDQLDYVTGTGQLQRVNTQQARAMGWNGDLSTLNTMPFTLAAQLEAAPPSQLPQQTLDSIKAYADLNTGAQNSALANAGATGMYYAPQQIYAPGTDMSGGTFSALPLATQQAYYASSGGDWQAAMNKWVSDSNAQITQWSQQNGMPLPNQRGAGQETLTAQQQYWQQAQDTSTLYGQYYAPGAPGQTGQAGVNAPQAGQQTLAGNEQAYTQWLRTQQQADTEWNNQQTATNNYLTLLSGLRGPADWAQYQKVLGATPQGTQDLVRAAAGQYIPGGGATTGVQPQAANLNTLYNQATGQAGGQSQQDLAQMQGTLVAPNQMAPQTWNALQPSQQQMALSVWESQGYDRTDAENLFKQSLPKYATQGAGSGSFRLQ